jgi:hypothetical protein
MWLVTILVLLAGGVLGAAGAIVARKPNAKELIDKLTPYQGWIGAVMCLWGIWDTINCLRLLGIIAHAPLLFTVYVVSSVTELLLGFLLGYGLINKYALSKNPQAAAKGEEMQKKLITFQVPLGFIAIGVGLFYLIGFIFLFH